VSLLSRQCGILNISQPYKPPRPVMGSASLYLTLACVSHAAVVAPLLREEGWRTATTAPLRPTHADLQRALLSRATAHEPLPAVGSPAFASGSPVTGINCLEVTASCFRTKPERRRRKGAKPNMTFFFVNLKLCFVLSPADGVFRCLLCGLRSALLPDAVFPARPQDGAKTPSPYVYHYWH
jgi:hypothetical protein